MRKFSPVDAALAGFQFVREEPRIAAIWSVMFLLLSLGFGTVMVTVAGPALMRLQAVQRQPLAPAQAMAMLHDVAPLYGMFTVFSLAFYSVLYAAMNRAVLRPSQVGFAYLHVGMDEVRQLLLGLLAGLFGLALYIGVVVLTVVVAIAAGVGLGKGPAAFIAVGLMLVVGLGALAYVIIRLSLASALTFDTGRVNLFGSWALTRGQFWRLLGCYMIVMALMIAVCLLFMVIAGALAMVFGGVSGMSILLRPDMSSLGAYFSPARLVLTVIGAISSGVVFPVLMMPHPTIYAELRARDSEVAHTFA